MFSSHHKYGSGVTVVIVLIVMGCVIYGNNNNSTETSDNNNSTSPIPTPTPPVNVLTTLDIVGIWLVSFLGLVAVAIAIMFCIYTMRRGQRAEEAVATSPPAQMVDLSHLPAEGTRIFIDNVDVVLNDKVV
jgi:hypothetical protein